MTKRIIQLGLAAVTLVSTVAVADISLPVKTSTQDIDRLAKEAVKKNVAPGLAFALVEAGKLQWSGGYGFASLENKMPMTIDHVMHIASVSKTFIGTAAAHAALNDGYDLTRPLAEYSSVTIDHPNDPKHTLNFLHLATHTSGIVDEDETYEAGYAIGQQAFSESLQTFLQSYLQRKGKRYDDEENFNGDKPGEQRQYSNIAAGLAALAIADHVKKPFNDYTRDVIFKPLGMEHTAWFYSKLPETKFATVYKPEGNSFEAYPRYALATWPDGGLKTSVRDLSRYLAVMANRGKDDKKQVLDSKVVELATGPLELDDVSGMSDRLVGHGLFWSAKMASIGLQGRPLNGHTGSDPGVTTLMFFDPATSRGVIGFANADIDSREKMMMFYGLAAKVFELER